MANVLTGAVMSSQDAHLVMRGLKTLTLRIDRHCQSAQKVAELLYSHPATERMNRPGSELTPRSWTNFKGFHETVQNGFQAAGRPELPVGRRRRKAIVSAVVGSRRED
jgi:methionine-gamma-lyase